MTEGTASPEQVENRIMDFLDGRKFFMTGATGFLGKVMLEKLLRKCHGIKTIYVLIRPKRGKEPHQRLEEVFNQPLYDVVRKENPEAFKKVIPIPGDVTELECGISKADRQTLIENVDVIFHAAATIKFDEPLKRAVLLNTRGTREIVELAKEMKNLRVFMHISTAYCHTSEKVLKEITYPPPADPYKVIKCLEWMDDDMVEAISPKLIGSLPNSYAYSKALSEGIVSANMDKVPIIILRPSIIVPIWKDPLPGWTDNINGPTGLMIGAGKGVIRTMYCKEDNFADFVPVDIVCNAILIAAWYYDSYRKSDYRVFNLTSSTEFQVSWAEVLEIGKRAMQKVPLNNVVWYPGGSLKKSRFVHNICVFLFHLLPAYFIDFLIMLAGHKPVMLRVQRKVSKGFEVFEYYANNQWMFRNSNIISLRSVMNEEERESFLIDGDNVDIDEYFLTCTYAAREYILKEPRDTIPAARRHLFVMYWVDKIAKALFWWLVIYTMSSCSETVSDILQTFYRLVAQVWKQLPGLALLVPEDADTPSTV